MEIISLFCGNYEAKFFPGYGANCIELTNKQYDCSLFLPFETISKMQKDNSFFYGMPILFPPNRISEGKFSFDNREYVFSVNEPMRNCFLHGKLFESVFNIVHKEESLIEMEYKATPEKPYYSFPHSFTIVLRYELNNCGLLQTVIVKNDSDKPMPFGMGFHTTFRLPFVNGSNSESINLYLSADKEFYRDSNTLLPTGKEIFNSKPVCKMQEGSLRVNDLGISALVKDNGVHKAELFDKSKNISLVYETDEKYYYWMIYKEKDRNCISIEPQTWITNAPNLHLPAEQTGMQIIEPKKNIIMHSKIYIKEGK